MNLLMNLIIGSLLSIIDLYLITIYFDINIISIFKMKIGIFKYIILIFSIFLLMLANSIIKAYPITILFTFLSIILLLTICKGTFKENTKQIILFLILKIFLTVSITLTFSWIFNISLSTIYFHHFISYTVLIYFIEKYVFYICIILLSKNKIFSFRIFKTITIILFIYFGIVIIKDSNTLFYFPHIGRTFVFVMIVSIASLIFFDRYQVKHEIIEREQAITTQNILKEKEYLNKYNDSIDEIRTMRHDMHNTLHIIHGYLEAEQTSEATEYVCHLLGIMNNSSALVHIGIPCIDSVFDDKLKIMNKKNIKYTEHIAHVNIGCIERNSLAILIGLALDNAIEAAEKVEHNRFIKVEMKNSQQYLILRITNSIILGSRPNFYKTSKLTDSMNHGFGVKEIKHIASQYNGDVKYDTNDDNVILKVILNTSEKEDQS